MNDKQKREPLRAAKKQQQNTLAALKSAGTPRRRTKTKHVVKRSRGRKPQRRRKKGKPVKEIENRKKEK